MSPDSQHLLAIKFLEQLEQEETGLLSWGLVNGSFTVEELDDKADAFLNENDPDGVFSYDSDELIEYLENKGLIFNLPLVQERRYRTRMAESVRLLSRLRQLFPKHIRDSNWQTAPTLVADYRFLRRPRVYPERSIDAQQAYQDITSNNNLTDIQKKIIEALLQTVLSTPLKLTGFQLRSTNSILSGVKRKSSNGTIICAGTGSGKT